MHQKNAENEDQLHLNQYWQCDIHFKIRNKYILFVQISSEVFLFEIFDENISQFLDAMDGPIGNIGLTTRVRFYIHIS